MFIKLLLELGFVNLFFGQGFSFNCPPSLLYNSTAELCDWPERVECSKAADDDTAATKSARSGDNPEIIDIDDKFECPGPGSYPVPTSCAFYYSCTMLGGLLKVCINTFVARTFV